MIITGKTESIKMQKGKAMRGKIPSALSSRFDLGGFLMLRNVLVKRRNSLENVYVH